METNMMHLQDGGTYQLAASELAFEERSRESITSARGKMNDSGSGDTRDARTGEMEYHEQIRAIYDWGYQNGEPDEGANPGLDYLQRLQVKARENGMAITIERLGWIHIEIFKERWRPVRYQN